MVGKGVAVVAGAAVEHPVAAGVVAAAVAVPTGIKWYQARYGGYAGELSPQQVGLLARGCVFPCLGVFPCLLGGRISRWGVADLG